MHQQTAQRVRARVCQPLAGRGALTSPLASLCSACPLSVSGSEADSNVRSMEMATDQPPPQPRCARLALSPRAERGLRGEVNPRSGLLNRSITERAVVAEKASELFRLSPPRPRHLSGSRSLPQKANAPHRIITSKEAGAEPVDLTPTRPPGVGLAASSPHAARGQAERSEAGGEATDSLARGADDLCTHPPKSGGRKSGQNIPCSHAVAPPRNLSSGGWDYTVTRATHMRRKGFC